MSRLLLSMADPAVAAMPVEECGDRLVDLRSVEELHLDARRLSRYAPYPNLREGVVARLLDAQRALPDGLRLLIVEGHRPLEMQRRSFADYNSQLQQENPSWPAEYVEQQASWYVSPPEFAPHVAGAAVDLTLCTADGEELPMGCRVNASPEARGGAGCIAAGPRSVLEGHHRRVFAAALSGAGLVNYPPAWWHWSFGDRYWAFATGATVATYGPIESAHLPR